MHFKIFLMNQYHQSKYFNTFENYLKKKTVQQEMIFKIQYV